MTLFISYLYSDLLVKTHVALINTIFTAKLNSFLISYYHHFPSQTECKSGSLYFPP